MSSVSQWRDVALGDVALFERSTIAPRDAGHRRYVGLEHVTSDGAILDSDIRAASLASDKFRFGPRHILYGKLRPYLRKVARPDFEGICSTDILPLLPSEDADRDYLFHALRDDAFVGLATTRSTGVNLPRISPRQLAEFSIPLPPLFEQKRIAAILDKADAIRAKRREALAQVDALLRAVFLDLFGDPVTNPKGWATARLGDVGAVGGGLSLTSARAANPLEAPYLRVANVFRDRLDLAEVKSIRLTASELARTSLEAGDLLIVEGHGNPAEIGRSAIWDGSIKECTHQNHLIRVRADRAKATPGYLNAWLNSAGGRRQLGNAGKTTSGLNTINISQVRDLLLPLPSIQFQAEFERTREVSLKMKRSLQQALDDADALYASLAQRAFRGEL